MLRDATLDSIRRTVSIVTQDPHMFHDTIRANLLYARPDASEAQLVDALRAARIRSLSLLYRTQFDVPATEQASA